ncbi:hypothetical protein FACS1894219_01760 [Clostridia bacterium]|nr:hypothetical protein FACS1894219_01760 [Clostridia bacterium]
MLLEKNHVLRLYLIYYDCREKELSRIECGERVNIEALVKTIRDNIMFLFDKRKQESALLSGCRGEQPPAVGLGQNSMG